MAKPKDHYATLNISKTASSEEISKAYKKLALKFHPNQHGNKSEEEKAELTKKFQEIHRAYTVLSDPDKRRKYDMFGTDDEQGQPGFNFNDMGNIFESFFGGGGGTTTFSFGEGMDDIFSNRGFMGSRQRGNTQSGFRSQQEAPENISQEYKLECSLEELYTGAKKSLKIRRSTLRGMEEKVIQLEILPGYKKGTKFRYPNTGDEYSPGKFKEFIVILEEKEEKIKREGDDLICEVHFQYEEFVRGDEKSVMLPGKRKVNVKGLNVEIIGGFMVMKNMGMKKRKGGTGDLKIRILVTNKFK